MDVSQSTKVKKAMNLTDRINQAIEKAVLEYYSDTSWNYRYEDQFICVVFYQDDIGTNMVDECSYRHNGNGIWLSIAPTDEQVKKMFKKLDDTPYRAVQEDEFTEADGYLNCGVRLENFY